MIKSRLLSLCLSAALLLPSGAISALPVHAEPEDNQGNVRENIPQEIYEAEDFADAAAIKDNADDYFGQGYVDNLSDPLTFTVDVPAAGDYGVRLRYISGSSLEGDGDKTLTVYANGQVVRQSTLPATITADTWAEKLESVPLEEGENTITYQVDQGDTAANVKVDRISLSRIYEAEDAQLTGNMHISTEHAGFSGTGFAAGFEAAGEEAIFTVDAPVAGEYSLVLGYGNGAEDYARSISVFVNGADAAQLSVAPLRTWAAWGEAQATVTLNEGENTVTVRNDNDYGHINLDYITLKPCNWQYAGSVEEVEGEGTSQLTFTLDNAAVQITSVAENAVKVWLEPSGVFDRKYDSFAVVDDAVDAQDLDVSDRGDYYEVDAGEITLRVQKDPFKLTYLDKAGNVLMENENDSMAWSTDGEVKVNSKIQDDEQFWGLGSNKVDFDRRGERIAMWSCDIVGADSEGVAPGWEEGRSDTAEPYYISSKGYSVYFDNTSYTVFDMGKTDPDTCTFGSFNPRAGGELLYYFTYGPSLKEITKTFTDIIGKSFFAPDWAMGNMQCHWGYTQNDIINIATEYRERGIPLDVIISDIDWYEYLCSPTEWNHESYPDPEGMFEALGQLNVRYGMINDPNVTDQGNNQYFVDGDTNKYFIKNQSGETKKVNWPWGAASGITDFFDPEARAWWGGQVQDLKAQGVEYIWMDMNEPSAYATDWLFWNEEGKSWGSINEMKNALATMHNLTLYEAMTEDGSRTFLQTRGGFTGSHKYAAPWTGDIGTTWQDMYEQIRMGTGLSLCGYNYWGFDIGGFNGTCTDDQFARWVQLATFTPVHRFHYISGNESREAWTHNGEENSKKYIGLRYRLMPYMYALSADSIIGIGLEENLGEGGTGLPMTRPMVMNYSDDQNTWELDTQFMMGDSFLVAPVVEDAETKEVYLPEGYWYDYDDGKTVYSGEQTMEYDAPIDLLPVFVKEGSIIPMQPEMQYVGEKPVDEITLDVYPTIEDGAFHFVLYEDDGETDAYQEGVYTTTRYEGRVQTGDTNTLTLEIGARTGSYTDIDDRDYLVQFHNAGYKNPAVTCDGAALTAVDSLEALDAAASGYYVDIAANMCYVKVHDDAAAHTIQVTGEPYTDLILEAEEGETAGSLTVSDAAVTGFTAEADTLTVTADLPAAGDYTVYVYYQAAADGQLTISAGEGSQVMPIKGGDDWQYGAVNLSLAQGENAIRIAGSGENTAVIAVDQVEVPLQLIQMPAVFDHEVQAETGTVTGGAEIASVDSGYTGEGYVKMDAAGEGVEIGGVTAMSDGTYTVNLRYANGGDDGTLHIYANGQADTAKQVQFTKLNGWSLWSEAIVNLELTAGENTITLVRQADDTGEVHIDRIICPLEPESFEEVPIVNGGFEDGSINGWTVTAASGDNNTGYGVDANDRLAGDYKFYFWQANADRTLSQTVELENGSYVLTAWVNAYSFDATADNACYLVAAGFAGDREISVNLSLSHSWVKYEIPVEVKDGKLDIIFRYHADSQTSLQLDEISLRRVEKGSAASGLAQLEAAIGAADGLAAAEYEEASWKAYLAALAMGRKTATDSSSTIEDYAAAITLIDRAQAALIEDHEPPVILKGDLDGDEEVTIADVMEACKVMARESAGTDPTDAEMERGDLDGDSEITIADVMEICKILARNG